MADLSCPALEILDRCRALGVRTGRHRYVALGPRGRIRWLVPTADRRASAALRSWRPYSPAARLAWVVVLASFQMASGGKDRSVGGEAVPVIYVGTEGPSQKAVCLMVLPNGEVEGVVKVPLGPRAGGTIMHEAGALEALREELPDLLVPRLLDTNHALGTTTQTWMRGGPSGRSFSRRHADFLWRLQLPQQRVSLAERRNGLEKRLAATDIPSAELRASTRRLLDSCNGDGQFAASWVHGDFAPWNLKLSGGQLAAYDWEDADGRGLPLHDLAHFFVNQSLLFRSRKPAFNALWSNREARQLIARHGIADVDAALLFRHYCAATVIASLERQNWAFAAYAARQAAWLGNLE